MKSTAGLDSTKYSGSSLKVWVPFVGHETLMSTDLHLNLHGVKIKMVESFP